MSLVPQRRQDGPSPGETALTMVGGKEAGGAVIKGGGGGERNSFLKAPIMLLTGHTGEVLTCKMDPTGRYIASGSFDREIFLWETRDECANYGVLRGHGNAVLQVEWSSDSSTVFSCSADRTVGAWDVETGKRIRRWKGHGGVVNGLGIQRRFAREGLVASASDDTSVRLWDERSKEAASTLPHPYQVTSVAVPEAGDLIYSGGLDEIIRVWDVRTSSVLYTLSGHGDTITGISLGEDGTSLVSASMDNTVKRWDVKPFVPGGDRCLATYYGAPHGMEKNLIRPAISPKGDRVACGSADRSVVIWKTETGEVEYKLPGHKGGVNQVDWHPVDPVIVSCSTDKTLYLGDVTQSKI